MQNTTTGTKGTGKQLHQVSESMRDTAEQLSSELGSKARNFVSNTADTAGQYYDQASSWMEQNTGKTLGIIGLVAASGLVGYFIGRNRLSQEQEFTPSPSIRHS